MLIETEQKISAESGLSHEGSLGYAVNFVEACSRAGADIIKFQMHFADAESSDKESFRVNFSIQDSTRWDYWKRTEFSTTQWEKIFVACLKFNVIPQVTVFSVRAIEVCRNLGINEVKLGSGDLDNLELSEAILDWSRVNRNLQLTISTGMANLRDVADAIERFEMFRSQEKLIVLQCTSMYPTPLEFVGLSTMLEIQEKFKVRVGLSDHSQGLNASFIALSLGANLVERHVVFDRRMFGPDTSSSITVDELSELVRFRNDLSILSKPVAKDEVSHRLESQRILFGRSLALKEPQKIGHIIEPQDFCLRKPAGGFAWKDRELFVGKALLQEYIGSEFLDLRHIK